MNRPLIARQGRRTLSGLEAYLRVRSGFATQTTRRCQLPRLPRVVSRPPVSNAVPIIFPGTARHVEGRAPAEPRRRLIAPQPQSGFESNSLSRPPVRSPTPDPLPLLLHPRVTLEVLEYVALHPNTSPRAALNDLGISLHTWYDALARLESLNLIALERYPGVRTRRSAELTQQGRAVLHLARGLRSAVEGSPAALELVLSETPPRHGSREAGDLILTLLGFAESRADYPAMDRLEARARALGRPGEAAYAAGLSRFLQGDRKGSLEPLKRAVDALGGESTTRSYRRASYFHAAALDALGDDKRAYLEFTKLRRLAQLAHDDVTESDTRLGIAILKAARNQWDDSRKQLDGALECAKRTGSPGRQAKVLTSLCLVDFMLDHNAGLPRSDEALAMAKKAGAKILIMHIRVNRSLMLAYQGERKAASREVREAKRISREVGHEHGVHAIKAWAALSRRIALYPRGAYRQDLRGQVSALMKRPTTQPPEE
jgi:DNA-binding MarR family transcriptional regulator